MLDPRRAAAYVVIAAFAFSALNACTRNPSVNPEEVHSTTYPMRAKAWGVAEDHVNVDLEAARQPDGDDDLLHEQYFMVLSREGEYMVSPPNDWVFVRPTDASYVTCQSIHDCGIERFEFPSSRHDEIAEISRGPLVASVMIDEQGNATIVDLQPR